MGDQGHNKETTWLLGLKNEKGGTEPLLSKRCYMHKTHGA